MKISIAIIEDDKNYNNALKKIIDFQSDMVCIAQFFNGKEAINSLIGLSPDVILLDIHLKDMLGVEVIDAVKSSMPNSHFLMCTNFEDDEKIFSSLSAGAAGYLVKGESMSKILNSVREINAGGAPMSFSVAKRVLQYFQKTKYDVTNQNILTKSEVEVLDTVKKHINNIYRKLQVKNRTEAINTFYPNSHQEQLKFNTLLKKN